MRILFWRTNVKSDYNGRLHLDIWSARKHREKGWSQQTLSNSGRGKQACWGNSSAMQRQSEPQPVSCFATKFTHAESGGSHQHNRKLCGWWRDDTPALHGLSATLALSANKHIDGKPICTPALRPLSQLCLYSHHPPRTLAKTTVSALSYLL